VLSCGVGNLGSQRGAAWALDEGRAIIAKSGIAHVARLTRLAVDDDVSD